VRIIFGVADVICNSEEGGGATITGTAEGDEEREGKFFVSRWDGQPSKLDGLRGSAGTAKVWQPRHPRNGKVK
jgi:hypothetical protein